MTVAASDSLRSVRIGLARIQHLIGWAGVIGIVLFAGAVGVISLAWSAHRAFLASQGSVPSQVALPTVPALSPATPSTRPELPSARDIPLLLTQIKQAAVASGLDWRAADYRLVAATPDKPASLEVRCSVKGAYPNLRNMLVQLIDSVPAFAIREFGVSRPNADVPDVEAKLVLAVFLQDEGLASASAGRGLR